MATFRSARNALACAAAIQQGELAESQPLDVRVGLSAGEVIERDGDVHGLAVAAAARLAAHATGREILAADLVRQLAGVDPSLRFVDRGLVELRGLPEVVRIVALDWGPPPKQVARRPAEAGVPVAEAGPSSNPSPLVVQTPGYAPPARRPRRCARALAFSLPTARRRAVTIAAPRSRSRVAGTSGGVYVCTRTNERIAYLLSSSAPHMLWSWSNDAEGRPWTTSTSSRSASTGARAAHAGGGGTGSSNKPSVPTPTLRRPHPQDVVATCVKQIPNTNVRIRTHRSARPWVPTTKRVVTTRAIRWPVVHTRQSGGIEPSPFVGVVITRKAGDMLRRRALTPTTLLVGVAAVCTALASCAIVAAAPASAGPTVVDLAAPVVAPPFDASYEAFDLGSVPGVPPLYGGLTLLAGDTDTLLIGGNANEEPGALYAIDVVRDTNGHITGFDGTATRVIDAAWNDGGVTYGPGGVLFLARWPVNQLGQTKPGSTTTDKIIDMTPLGVGTDSLAALAFVPAGFPGEGQLKLLNWEQGNWYSAGVAPDGNGTFDVVGVTPVPGSQLPGGPEGFIYVPIGSPEFPDPSILIADFSDNSVSAYEIDANGDPVVTTRQAFITGLEGAEGAYIDPVTGDFLFSTFGGGDRVVAVRGFEPPPPNNPPIATDLQLDTIVDQPIAIELGGSDPDGDAVTVTSASDPPNGTLSGQLPSVSYQPDPGFTGTDSFDFVVDDGNGGTDLGTVTIVVGLAPSHLVAHPAVATLNPFRLTLALAATLTDSTGTPLAGQPVRFVIGGQHLCTGVTAGNGFAVCTSNPGLWLLALLHLGYDAHYDGDATHLPSSSHGPILG